MNTITTLDDNIIVNTINPGAQLANIREQRGYTLEYVATKLRLRVRVIELIENNEFDLLPSPVFIKGYLRAYALLLDVSPEPYLTAFNSQYTSVEKKVDRAALWQQTKRESHKAEHAIRWFTVLFALGVVVAVGIWWQKNQDNQQQLFSEKDAGTEVSMTPTTTTEIKLTDISQMESILAPKPEMSSVENIGD